MYISSIHWTTEC